MSENRVRKVKMRCALYARVSTTDQTCEMQLRELREYISRREWKNAGEYVDTGFSGAKASRPALDRLMSDSAQRKFDCIIASKIDRFGRSVLHLYQQLAALTRHGVRFIATSQALDTDEKNPTSGLLLQILASVAEFEREMIPERTQNAEAEQESCIGLPAYRRRMGLARRVCESQSDSDEMERLTRLRRRSAAQSNYKSSFRRGHMTAAIDLSVLRGATTWGRITRAAN